jgi:putative protease
LLSPAKNAECGIEAVNHGADAVYIGAPKFSARASASNSIREIESLVKYAHRYYARIYVALNTILDDRELEEAEKIIWQLYDAGADALIIQDMGITRLNLPPISLHASTQTDNRTPEKVRFLEEAGFDQVVLARELTISQIKEISDYTSVRLEAFVHGALCVSYSGQCYISQAVCKRSANQGACAQLCRLPYSLVDSGGNIIAGDKHLLSLKDLNLSGHLKELMDAGISSLKIEGRLKEVSYVKNITAFYRQKLDSILSCTSFKKSSSGTCRYNFIPDPEKSFHRGSTSYFLHGRNEKITSFDTPKSLGEYIGIVKSSDPSFLVLESDKTFSNGDGFCYLDAHARFSGFRANRVEGNKIFLLENQVIPKGSKIYRNFNHLFEKSLSKDSADRKIAVRITLSETNSGFRIFVEDEDNISVNLTKDIAKEEAIQPEKSLDQLKKGLSKTGNSIFTVTDVTIISDKVYFLPPGIISQWKKEVIERLYQERETRYPFITSPFLPTVHPYPVNSLNYLGNVHNRKAFDFYKMHQVKEIKFSYEKEGGEDVTLMFCKHCLKFSLGMCPKNGKNKQFKEPFYLVSGNNRLKLIFDCQVCEMKIVNS